jgi:hypothetical protein
MITQRKLYAPPAFNFKIFAFPTHNIFHVFCVVLTISKNYFSNIMSCLTIKIIRIYKKGKLKEVIMLNTKYVNVYVRFEVITAVTMKIYLLWYECVVSCSLVNR